MPVAVNKRKRLNCSQHSRVQQSLVTLASSKSHYDKENVKENYSPALKTHTQQKLYSILNQPKAITPFTNRTVNNRENILSLLNQSTNRVNMNMRIKESHHSAIQRDAINTKINQMLENSVIHRMDSAMSNEGDKVKFSMNQLQRLNIVEREKIDLKNIINLQEDKIQKLEATTRKLSLVISEQAIQIESFQNISEQVSDLDKYCNELLSQNDQLKYKLSQNSELLFHQLIKDMFIKCRLLENNLQQLGITFSKCNKLSMMIYNKEELPIEMFMQRLKKESSALTQESNLLSPVDNPFNQIEYHQKINDIISFANHTSQQMLKKGQKTLEQFSSKFIMNITDTFNQFSQY